MEIYRPILSLALLHLISSSLGVHQSPSLISQNRLLSVLRSTADVLVGVGHDLSTSVLGELGREGRLDLLGRDVFGGELGREMWRRIMG